MCGFTGIVDRHGIRSACITGIERAAERIAHRGPNASGFFSNDQLALAHRRLSIIDPDERANQPMRSQCGRYLLVYNGEVYNYKALRRQLEQRNHSFTTESDTEVVLYHLMEFGDNGIAAFNGCFALAFIDLHEGSVLLVRDRFGINPLWYSIESEARLSFASEEKALVCTETHPVRRQALADILHFSYNPEHSSAREAIFRLPPGSYLKWPNSSTPIPWFSPTARESSMPPVPLRDALEAAVIRRLVADVPVGCFLSGGIDSSIVSALAARHHARINTFSVGFKEFAAFDESQAARTVAQHIGSTHHDFQMTLDDLERHARRVLESADEPFGDSSAIAASFLAEQTAKHVTVALSGDGADELLGGYRKHKAHAVYSGTGPVQAAAIGILLQTLARITHGKRAEQLRKLASVATLSAADRYFALARFSRPEDVAVIFPHASAEGENRHRIRSLFDRHPEKLAALYADQLMVLPNDMLTKVDLTSMRHSLEVRVPFLDPEVVVCINASPVNQRYSWQRGKQPLRTQFNDLLPASVFARKKQGFEVPLAHLLRTALHADVAGIVNSDVLNGHGFQRTGLASLVNRFVQGDDALAPLMYTLLHIETWLQRHSNGIE